MSAYVMPAIGNYQSEAFRKPVRHGFNNEDYVPMAHGIAHKWNGKRMMSTSYA